MRLSRRHQQALQEGGNLIGLSVAAALSAATLNFLPLLIALVAETAYLLFVPDSRWYEQRLARRHDAEIARRRAELKDRILPQLSAGVRNRFLRLERVRDDIAAHPPDPRLLVADDGWFREVLRKLDFLLDKFLQFAQKELQFRAYLQSIVEEVRNERRVPPRGPRPGSAVWIPDPPRDTRKSRGDRSRGRRGEEGILEEPERAGPAEAEQLWVQRSVEEIQGHYSEEMDGLRTQLQNDSDGSTRAVLEKRLAILERRREFIGKLGRIVTNLSQQIHLLEDTFGLINDEVRTRPPEQVLADIEDVVTQTQTMTEVLEEVAPMEQMMTRMVE